MTDRSEFTEHRRSQFERHAAIYDGRPGYPVEVFEHLGSRCGLGPERRVLEVGPGTGQATAALLDAGARVTAVEIGSDLADRLASRFAGSPLTVIVGDFESVDLGTEPFDLVAAATSFHWIDPRSGLSRVAQHLHGGGWVALWWNCYGVPGQPDPFVDALRPALQRHASHLIGNGSAGLAPHPYALDAGSRRRERASIQQFRSVEDHRFRWTARHDAGQLKRFLGSFSPWMQLDDRTRVRLFDEVEHIVTARFGGSVERSYLTTMYTAQRR